MTALPTAISMIDNSVTEAQFKTELSNILSYLSGLLGTNGVPSTALATLQGLCAAGVIGVPGAYTVTAADKGKVLSCYGAGGSTLSLTASATLGGLFSFAVRNSSSGVVTVDPAGSEVIDGAPTLALQPGATAILVCTGGEWISIGNYDASTITPVSSGGTGSTTAAGARDSLAVVGRDHGHNVVGSYVMAATTGSSGVVAGATASGDTLLTCGGSRSFSSAQTGDLAGTWRCLGFAAGFTQSSDPTTYTYYGTLWQRIA